MSFWKKLVGLDIGAADDAAIFKDRLQKHLSRVESAGNPYRQFISRYMGGDVIDLLAGFAAEKMDLTRRDGQEHSFAVSKLPICYQICTLKSSVPDAKKWFIERYGGYSRLLEMSWNSSQFRSNNCEVFVHIVYARTTSDAWVNLTIFPVDSPNFTFQPVLPIDLLTESETHV